ncbi:MAG: type IX secretion system membrane protein PorP/SprF [Bacteroidales bacterium]|nr:type IX secretion system membrane protein PorP/SprF [Bacteroidales bacterium]
MKLVFNKIYIITLFVCFKQFVFSQDPQFSQFYATPLYLSPSFAGISSGSRVVLNFRDQWPKMPGRFITFAVSGDHNLRSLKSGVGILITRDQIGSGKLSTTNVGGLYSYRIKINRNWTIRPGLHLMYTQKSIDYYSLNFVEEVHHGTQIGEPNEYLNNQYVDFSSSILTYNKDFWLGSTVDHMLRPNQALMGGNNRVPMKFSFYGGLKVNIRGRMRALKASAENITFAFLYKYREQKNLTFKQQNSQFDLGLYWSKTPIVVGLWYRGIPIIKENKGSDAIILLFGYKVDEFSVGYSYDFTVSRLIASTGGAHEISIIYLFNVSKYRKAKREMIPCPHF